MHGLKDTLFLLKSGSLVYTLEKNLLKANILLHLNQNFINFIVIPKKT